MESRLPPKKDCALQLLEQTSLFIHLDPRMPGVMVPQWFRQQPYLTLQVGLNMAVPIHDLRVEEEGISCTLSFNRTPFFCVLPWNAIFALSGEDGRGMIWPEEVPYEVAPKFGLQKAPPPPKAPHLRAVSSETPAPLPKPQSNPEEAKAEEKPKKVRKKAVAKSEKGAEKADKAPTKPKAKRAPKGAKLADEPIRPAPSSPLIEAGTEAPKPEKKPEAVSDAPRSKRELPPYLRIVK